MGYFNASNLNGNYMGTIITDFATVPAKLREASSQIRNLNSNR